MKLAASQRSATLTPKARLKKGKTYTVKVTRTIHDAAGNHLTTVRLVVHRLSRSAMELIDTAPPPDLADDAGLEAAPRRRRPRTPSVASRCGASWWPAGCTWRC